VEPAMQIFLEDFLWPQPTNKPAGLPQTISQAKAITRIRHPAQEEKPLRLSFLYVGILDILVKNQGARPRAGKNT